MLREMTAAIIALLWAVSEAAGEQSANHFRQLNGLPGEFQVNTYTTNAQDHPAIAVLADDGFVITWESYGQDGTQYGIFAQRYDSSGTPVGSEFQVNTYTVNNQEYPDIAPLSNGGFIITWQSYSTEGYEVLAQRYDSAGSTDGAIFRVNTFMNGIQVYPDVATFSHGGSIVTWMSKLQDGSVFGIYAQRYDSSGAAEGQEFRVNTVTLDDQIWQAVASLSNDGCIIVWTGRSPDIVTGDCIFAQLYDSSGAPVGSEFQVNTYTTNQQTYAEVAALLNGGFIITWTSEEQDGSGYGIFAQRYDSSGTPVGSEFQVNTYTLNDQTYPSVASFSDGGFIITWSSDGQDGSGNGIFAQMHDSSGAAVGSEFQVNTYTTNAQQWSAVASFSDDRYIVTWESVQQDGSSGGVYASFSGSSGTTLPSAVPTSVPTSPTGIPTSNPTEAPTSAPTSPTSIPTSIPSAAPGPTSIPSCVPSSAPTSIPTSQPTIGVSDHIVVHLYDLHGDGWFDNVYLRVNHANGSDLYSLHCSCKVVRIFTADISLSLWRNRTIPGPKGDVMPYEWEALWTVGYSDGVTETDFGIVGDINTKVEIRNYALFAAERVMDIDYHHPTNMCIPPKPKPKESPIALNSTKNKVSNTTESTLLDVPSPTVDVTLALMTTNGISWCDDSGSTSILACDKEHHLSTDAVLPNLAIYPRYYISRIDDNRIVASGTLREDVTEWVTSVNLLREGSYVFSVSGTYTALSGSVAWSFCGEEGGINERLHFNMVKSVCHAHFIEEVSGAMTCYEISNAVLIQLPLDMHVSESLQFFRESLSYLMLPVGAIVCLTLFIVMARKKGKKFIRLDTTEHSK